MDVLRLVLQQLLGEERHDAYRLMRDLQKCAARLALRHNSNSARKSLCTGSQTNPTACPQHSACILRSAAALRSLCC